MCLLLNNAADAQAQLQIETQTFVLPSPSPDAAAVTEQSDRRASWQQANSTGQRMLPDCRQTLHGSTVQGFR